MSKHGMTAQEKQPHGNNFEMPEYLKEYNLYRTGENYML